MKSCLVFLAYCYFILEIKAQDSNLLQWHTENIGSTQLNVCFTPGQNCTELILQVLQQAQSSIRVQAYDFTSSPIAQALCQASKRGLKIEVLLDRSQLKQKSSQLLTLKQAGIPVYIDEVPGIAHNKIMIIDENSVLTGSFNWSHNAQFKNAENLLWIKNQNFAQIYILNWQHRRQTAVESSILLNTSKSAVIYSANP